jgi:predicted O-methyltransferase YrrM
MDDGQDLLNWHTGARSDAPPGLDAIAADTRAMGFDMASDAALGRFLRLLVASKPGGTMLELGTGTGLATAWMLDGLTLEAKLVSVDNDAAVQQVAHRHLGHNRALTLCCADGGDFVSALEPMQFDLVFADAWPGKFSHLDAALALLREGGIYVVDDLLPQANWPTGHQANVDASIATMQGRADFAVSRLDWGSGLLVAARTG